MKALFLLFGFVAASLLMAGCGNSGKGSSEKEVNPADTIYLGDLRDKFKGDTLFFNAVTPDLVLIQNQYTWVTTVDKAKEKGITERYYKKVQQEISKTNEAIRDGIMLGANAKRIPDFQEDSK